MTTEPAATRARSVIAGNNYFVLATQDDEGPWAAALAFTRVAPNYLCFFSERTSRHGAAIADGAPVAGVIYNSQAAPEDVESIQFSGWGELAHDRETIGAVLRAAHAHADNPPPTDEEIESHLKKEATPLFRVSVEKAYVLDQHLYNDKGTDAREPVDPAVLFSSDG